MKKINLAAVPVQESRSPKGRFRYFSQDLLTAMRQTNQTVFTCKITLTIGTAVLHRISHYLQTLLLYK